MKKVGNNQDKCQFAGKRKKASPNTWGFFVSWGGKGSDIINMSIHRAPARVRVEGCGSWEVRVPSLSQNHILRIPIADKAKFSANEFAVFPHKRDVKFHSKFLESHSLGNSLK